jgi:hypothetical protein
MKMIITKLNIKKNNLKKINKNIGKKRLKQESLTEIQVKRPITKLYNWAQGGRREKGRVLPYPVFAPIFCVKFSSF